MTSAAKRGSGLGKILALGTLGAILWFTRKSAPQAAKGEQHSAAFADGETQSENFDQTRSAGPEDRKSTRLELQSLMRISYAVFCLKKKISTNESKPTQQVYKNNATQHMECSNIRRHI